MYILKFENKDSPEDTFIKIGRTFDIRRRINSFPKVYNIEIISTVEGTHKVIYELEEELHNQCKSNGMRPLIYFGGSSTECFTLDILNNHNLTDYINN